MAAASSSVSSKPPAHPKAPPNSYDSLGTMFNSKFSGLSVAVQGTELDRKPPPPRKFSYLHGVSYLHGGCSPNSNSSGSSSSVSTPTASATDLTNIGPSFVKHVIRTVRLSSTSTSAPSSPGFGPQAYPGRCSSAQSEGSSGSQSARVPGVATVSTQLTAPIVTAASQETDNASALNSSAPVTPTHASASSAPLSIFEVLRLPRSKSNWKTPS
jgi:hypothetical protein